MSGSQSAQSKHVLEQNRALAEKYYGLAIPSLQGRFGEINQSLAQGEPQYLKSAFEGQRTGLTEGLAARGAMAQAQQMEGAGRALSGGNAFAALHPADMGAQLANALYGSKFQEGQANLDQQFNLISMGLGGAGTTGNAALGAAGNQLNAIGYMPNYNPAYAGALGIANLGLGAYGAVNQAYPQLFGAPGTTNTGATLPTGWSSSSVPS